MKNTIKYLVAIIGMVVVLIASISVNAQVSSGGGSGGVEPCPPLIIPEQLPIGDVADLQAYAWEQVAQIGMWSWASSAINNNEKSSVWLQYTNGVVDVEEVLGIIKVQQLVLQVLYPSDNLYLQTGLYSREGEALFFAQNTSVINPPVGGVSKNTLDVVLEMNPEIWIPFSGARWFYIVERDDAGNAVRYYNSREWDVQNGKIRFPGYFAKKGGEIRVILCDGTEVAYSLKGGKKIVPTTVQVEIGKVSVLGMRTFRDTNLVYVSVSAEELKRDINPLSQLINPTDRWVELAASVMDPQSGMVVFAYEVSIWPQGQSSDTVQPIESSTPADRRQAYLPAGSYWVKFGSFPNGWPFGNQFPPPYQYYGGATTPVVEEK